MAGRRGNNEGSITKLDDGRWMGRVSMPDGTRKSVRRDTRAEVIAEIKRLLDEAEHRRGLLPGHDFTTLRQFFEVWVASKAHSRSERTAEIYGYYVRHYCKDLLGLAPRQVTAAHIQQLYGKLFKEGLSPTTISGVHRMLHTAFEAAMRQGVMPRNPTDQIDAPRATRGERTTWNIAETQRFLEAIASDRYEALFILALSTGMRQGELLGLRWSRVNLERGWIQVQGNLQRVKSKLTVRHTKTTASTHLVYLPSLTIAALAQHRERQMEEAEAMGDKWNNGNDLVFTSTRGTPVAKENLTVRHFKPAIERAGIPDIPFHNMRHTAATLLLEAGMHPKLVSEMLGHSSVQTTMDLYSHATPAMHQAATVVMQQILSGEMLAFTNGNGMLALPEPSEELIALRAWKDKTSALVQAFANGIDVDRLFCRRCLCMLPDHQEDCERNEA